MNNTYGQALTATWVLGLIVSIILIIAHVLMLNPDLMTNSLSYDLPEVDAVLNSHARIMLALGVTSVAFIAWLIVGATQRAEPATRTVAGSPEV